MPLEKLNMLADTYRQTRSNETFRAIYDALGEKRKIHQSIVIRSGLGDESDAIVIFHDVLIRILNKDVEFGRIFFRSLKNGRTDFFRRKQRERTRQRSLNAMVDEMDEGAATPEILRSDYDLETEVVKKREADHRQVIDSLVSDPAKVDTVTTLIVTEFLRYDNNGALQYPSIAALAKALGLNHEVVRRKLVRLSRHYDANRFGDYRDYLAV